MFVAIGMLVACRLVAAGISGVRAEISPYAGMQNRGLKALSEQQIEDLRGGRGMGMALAAELNGYPGPVRVVELASALGVMHVPALMLERLKQVLVSMLLCHVQIDTDAHEQRRPDEGKGWRLATAFRLIGFAQRRRRALAPVASDGRLGDRFVR
jgi:hypothetical protein